MTIALATSPFAQGLIVFDNTQWLQFEGSATTFVYRCFKEPFYLPFRIEWIRQLHPTKQTAHMSSTEKSLGQ
jgi:hypothetical protein